MKKIISIKSANDDLIVSFTCHNKCDTCSFRFKCYTTVENVNLLAIDIDERLWDTPREMFSDLIGISDDEFYLRAFKLVTQR